MTDRLTDQERERMLAAASTRVHGNGKTYRHAERDRLILGLMLEAGLRPGEISELRCGWVRNNEPAMDLHDRSIRLPHGLWDRLWPWVAPRRKRNDRSFPLTVRQITNIAACYGRRAGMARKVTPDMLRRTFAWRAFPIHLKTLEDVAAHLGISPRYAVRYLEDHNIGGDAGHSEKDLAHAS